MPEIREISKEFYAEADIIISFQRAEVIILSTACGEHILSFKLQELGQ